MAKFTKQVVVCLANDLGETATAIGNKERDGCTCSIIRYGDWDGGMPASKLSGKGESYKLEGLRSRLIIVAHGSPDSKAINGNAKLTGKKLAEFVTNLLDSRVGRITLHMCYGGGNMPEQGKQGIWTSIACDFASHAGHLTRQVTARTDVVSGTYYADTLENFSRTVGGRARDKRVVTDKVLFLVAAGSNLDTEITPQAQFTTHAAAPWA